MAAVTVTPSPSATTPSLSVKVIDSVSLNHGQGNFRDEEASYKRRSIPTPEEYLRIPLATSRSSPPGWLDHGQERVYSECTT